MVAIQAKKTEESFIDHDATFGRRYVRVAVAGISGGMIGFVTAFAIRAIALGSSWPVLTGINIVDSGRHSGQILNVRDLMLLYAIWNTGTWLAEKVTSAPKTKLGAE